MMFFHACARKIGKSLTLYTVLHTSLIVAITFNVPSILVSASEGSVALVPINSGSLRDVVISSAVAQLKSPQHYLYGQEGQIGAFSPWSVVVEGKTYTCKGPGMGLGPCTEHKHFDCSGLVHYCYKQAGTDLPRRTSSGYYANCYDISESELRKGDLVFLQKDGTIYHVGIYEGGDNIMNAITTDLDGVTYNRVKRSSLALWKSKRTVLYASVWAIDLHCPDNKHGVLPEGSTTYIIEVYNYGDVTDTISLERSTPPSGWTVSLPGYAPPVSAHDYVYVYLTVTAPPDAKVGDSATITVTGTSIGDTISTVTTDTVTTITMVIPEFPFAGPLVTLVAAYVALLIRGKFSKVKLPRSRRRGGINLYVY